MTTGEWAKRTAGFFILFSVAGCRTPRPPEYMEPHPPETPFVPPPSADESDEPAKLEPSGALACTLEAHPAAAGITLQVRVRKAALAGAGTPAILTVHDAAAKLGFAVGEDPAVSASLDTKDVHVDGFVARRDVPLHIRPSHLMASGVLVPGAKMPVEVVGAEPGLFRVHLPSAGLLEIPETIANDSIPCADIDTLPFPAPMPRSGKPVSLEAKKGLEIRATPESTVFVTLHVPEATVDLPIDATKLETKDHFVRVEIPGPDASIIGWVPATQVHARAKAPLAGVHRSDEPPSAPSHPAVKERPEGVECKVAVPFAVPESTTGSAKLVWAGSIREETTIVPSDEPGPERPAWRRIRLRNVSANVPILVRTETLSTCMKKL